MSYLSIAFYGFVIVLFACYYLFARIAPKHQWVVLLAGSIFFYSCTKPIFLCFLFTSIITSYATGRLMEYTGRLGIKRLLLILCLAVNIGILMTVKLDHDILMPLGISFYTFQCIGYLSDVYNRKIEAEKNFLVFALYVSFFPQIAQGPLGRYADLKPQLVASHQFDYDQFAMGCIRLLVGVFKKAFIANQAAIFVDAVYGSPSEYSGIAGLVATILYAIQLYADFSGYMDIVLGVGMCLGIRMEENFQRPYFSKNIAEYWRRWHITLGAWVREYVFYPLQLSPVVVNMRKKLKRSGHKWASKMIPAYIGLFFTWLIIGVWHGTDVSFLLHAALHGGIIMLSMTLEPVTKRINGALHAEGRVWDAFRVIRTFLIVNIGYVFFRSANLADATSIYHSILFRFLDADWKGQLHNETMSTAYWCFILAGIVALLIYDWILSKKAIEQFIYEKPMVVRWIILFGLLLVSILFFNNEAPGATNFLYYQF